MLLEKRYRCYTEWDGEYVCYDGFWQSDKGVIAKWVILAVFFFFFFGWFFGGYLHAKSRLRKGLPLLAYHRWLISYNERRRYGQTPQNHFTFYAPAQPYAPRNDGNGADIPPVYNGGDAPPSYFAPGYKTYPQQAPPQYGMTPQQPAPAYPMAPQQTGVAGSSSQMDVENQNHNQPQTQTQGSDLPPRPQQAKLALTNFMSRFRK